MADARLWTLLPRDLQEHIARFLAQKMLWRLLHPPKHKGLGLNVLTHTANHLAEIVDLMQANPLFKRALFTAYLLSVPKDRWHHHHAFANGLVRFAWEVHDRRLVTAHGASHVSVPWVLSNEGLRADSIRFKRGMFVRFQEIARQAYLQHRSRYLPEHYVDEICAAIKQGAHRGTLCRIDGFLRTSYVTYLALIVNVQWHGRTKKQCAKVKARIAETMERSFQTVPQAPPNSNAPATV